MSSSLWVTSLDPCSTAIQTHVLSSCLSSNASPPGRSPLRPSAYDCPLGVSLKLTNSSSAAISPKESTRVPGCHTPSTPHVRTSLWAAEHLLMATGTHITEAFFFCSARVACVSPLHPALARSPPGTLLPPRFHLAGLGPRRSFWRLHLSAN